MPESKVKIVSQGIGRRKSAIASVRLISGSGQITVNNLPMASYFPGEDSKLRYTKPFTVTEISKYDATAMVHGGGPQGQLDALVLGIARALAELKHENRVLLRGANLLTRDARERQRRMVGMGGKSRRKKQSPKR
jgi:small subunit ribosomal protein S9